MPHLVTHRFSRPAFAPVIVVAIALALTGCGRRGALEAPPGASGQSATDQSSATRLAPGIGGTVPRQSAADRDPLSQPSRSGEFEEDEAPIQAPDRPFILDAIL